MYFPVYVPNALAHEIPNWNVSVGGGVDIALAIQMIVDIL